MQPVVIMKPSQAMIRSMLFDELANYSEYENHEYKAFIEFLANNDEGYDIEFMGRRHTEGYGFRLV